MGVVSWMVPVGAGVAVLGAGLLFRAALGLRDEVRVLRLAGLPPPAEPPPTDRSGSFQDWATRRGWPYGAAAYLAVAGAGGVVAALAGFRLMGPVGLGLGLVASPAGLEWVLARRRRVTSDRAEGQLREAVVALASAVRAGRSVRRAVDEAAGEVEPPMRDHLVDVLERLETGEPIDDALRSFARTVGSPDAHLVVTLLGIHRRTGGDLPTMLDELAAIVGLRSDARRRLRALTAQGRASGAVLAVLPIAFVTLLSWTGGNGLGTFYRTPQGAGLLLTGLALDGAGFWWIRRILEPR